MGFYFYRLAENHQKNKWLFGILGIVIFITGYFSYVLFYRFFILENIEMIDYATVNFKSFITGLVFVFIVFQILNFIWNRKKKIDIKTIDEIGK